MSQKSCKCDKCVAACRTRPCWGTPEDAEKLMNAGHADKLMDDYWVGDGPDDSDVHLLCPAIVGYEGCSAPETSFMSMALGVNGSGRCTFLDDDNLCTIHKLKPTEGRLGLPCRESQQKGYARHKRIAMSWNNKDAQAFVKRWHRFIAEKGRKRA